VNDQFSGVIDDPVVVNDGFFSVIDDPLVVNDDFLVVNDDFREMAPRRPGNGQKRSSQGRRTRQSRIFGRNTF